MRSDVIVGHDGKPRCVWAGSGDTAFARYHDDVWGTRSYDESAMFEALTLGVFEVGLSWSIVFGKREALEVAGLPLRRAHERVCVHAERRRGQRPRPWLLSRDRPPWQSQKPLKFAMRVVSELRARYDAELRKHAVQVRTEDVRRASL